MYEIEIYEDKDANAPIYDFIEDLNTKAKTSKLDRVRLKMIFGSSVQCRSEYYSYTGKTISFYCCTTL